MCLPSTNASRVTLLGLMVMALPAAADEVTYDFRGRHYDEKDFRTTGSNAHKLMQIDDQGLRIDIPANHVNSLPVGLVLRQGIHGDFQITMAFELLEVDTPTSGTGAGASIYITMVSASKEAATIARVMRPTGEHQLVAHRASTPPDGKRLHRGEAFRTEFASGKLRLVRTGSLLSYQIADGNGEFREWHQTELGTDDLDTVRFAADNGGSPTAVSARINYITIQAEDLGQPRAIPPPSRWPYKVVIAGAFVVLLGSAAGWYYVRRRKAL
jgi:Protein of unknown function (DUF1583)